MSYHNSRRSRRHNRLGRHGRSRSSRHARRTAGRCQPRRTVLRGALRVRYERRRCCPHCRRRRRRRRQTQGRHRAAERSRRRGLRTRCSSSRGGDGQVGLECDGAGCRGCGTGQPHGGCRQQRRQSGGRSDRHAGRQHRALEVRRRDTCARVSHTATRQDGAIPCPLRFGCSPGCDRRRCRHRGRNTGCMRLGRRATGGTTALAQARRTLVAHSGLALSLIARAHSGFGNALLRRGFGSGGSTRGDGRRGGIGLAGGRVLTGRRAGGCPLAPARAEIARLCRPPSGRGRGCCSGSRGGPGARNRQRTPGGPAATSQRPTRCARA
jgi:hypothetical protein